VVDAIGTEGELCVGTVVVVVWERWCWWCGVVEHKDLSVDENKGGVKCPK